MNTITAFISKFSAFLQKNRRQGDGGPAGDRVVVLEIPDDDTPSGSDIVLEAKLRLALAQTAHNANPNEANRHLLAEAIDRFHASCRMEKACGRAPGRPIGKIRAPHKCAANQNGR
jgi:hypothetical protein